MYLFLAGMIVGSFLGIMTLAIVSVGKRGDCQ